MTPKNTRKKQRKPLRTIFASFQNNVTIFFIPLQQI